MLRSSNPRQVIYDETAPTEGVRLGQLFVDTDEAPPTLYICTSLTPVTFVPIAGGGGGTPGGADTQVQFNDGGAFGGDSGFTFNKTNKTVDLGGGTLTASDPVLDLSQTWNNAAVTFTGLKYNVTNTASAAASNLIDLQLGGVSRFRLQRNGTVVAISDAGQPSQFGAMSWAPDGNQRATITSIGRVTVGSGGYFAIDSNGTASSGAPDAVLYRDAAGVFAQRNGTNAQALRVYNTWTDASNYERGKFAWESNLLKIGTESLGTGATRSVELVSGGSTKITIGTTLTMHAATSLNNNTLQGHRPVFAAVTADGTEGMAGRTITNRGATGTVTRTLLSYTDNLTYVRVASQLLRIEPPSGGRFRRADGTLEAVDKYLELASDGALLTVQNDGTEWLCIAERGTINVEP